MECAFPGLLLNRLVAGIASGTVKYAADIFEFLDKAYPIYDLNKKQLFRSQMKISLVPAKSASSLSDSKSLRPFDPKAADSSLGSSLTHFGRQADCHVPLEFVKMSGPGSQSFIIFCVRIPISVS